LDFNKLSTTLKRPHHSNDIHKVPAFSKAQTKGRTENVHPKTPLWCGWEYEANGKYTHETTYLIERQPSYSGK
jgi:hypothetical protein